MLTVVDQEYKTIQSQTFTLHNLVCHIPYPNFQSKVIAYTKKPPVLLLLF